MKFGNYMTLDFPSKSSNEAFARSAVACFAAQMDPTLEELGDSRTAVSEAVTNSIIHGMPRDGKVYITYTAEKNIFTVIVEDHGIGIENVEKAMEPLFTTKPELERSGMGFSFMEAFMDELTVLSEPGKGTIVKMSKIIGKGRKTWTTQSH